MDKKAAGKFSLDSLMSRVLPSLDITVPASMEGSKKFKRVRPTEGTATPASTATPTAAPASSAIITKPVSTSAPTGISSSVPFASSSISKTPTASRNISLPPDMAAAAAAAFEALIPAQATSPIVRGPGTEKITPAGVQKKNKKSQQRQGGGGVKKAVEAGGNTVGPTTAGASEEAVKTSVGGTEATTTPKKNRKRKKNQNGDNPQKQQGGGGPDSEGSAQADARLHHDNRLKKQRRKMDPQARIRNLDATPELVGVMPEDDFTTLLVQHQAHANKMLERDLERQNKEMMEAQKKQAKLLATQTAQLTDPQAQLQVQGQLKPQKKSNNKNQSAFVPRRNCVYFLNGFCRNDTSCKFKHDMAAREAHQAELAANEGMKASLSLAEMLKQQLEEVKQKQSQGAGGTNTDSSLATESINDAQAQMAYEM